MLEKHKKNHHKFKGQSKILYSKIGKKKNLLPFIENENEKRDKLIYNYTIWVRHASIFLFIGIALIFVNGFLTIILLICGSIMILFITIDYIIEAMKLKTKKRKIPWKMRFYLFFIIIVIITLIIAVIQLIINPKDFF